MAAFAMVQILRSQIVISRCVETSGSKDSSGGMRECSASKYLGHHGAQNLALVLNGMAEAMPFPNRTGEAPVPTQALPVPPKYRGTRAGAPRPSSDVLNS